MRCSLLTFLLQQIFVIKNPITTVSTESLQGLPLNQFVIKERVLTVPPSISAVCTTLKVLSFSRNHIAYISDDNLHNCDSLVRVYFSFYRLKYCTDISCISDTIEHVDISNNMVQGIRHLLDSKFPKLSGLNLQHNQIRYLIYDHNKTPRLSLLNIAHNNLFHISHLNSLITAPMPKSDISYISVELAYTPWYCSDEYKWILKLLCTDGSVVIGACFSRTRVINFLSHKSYTSRFCDINNMLCASPPNTDGSTIRNSGEIP